MGAAIERRLRHFLLGLIAATLMAQFAAVSLGLDTFAAYVDLSASEGRGVAALIVGAAYGLLAITIWAIGVARRRAGRLRRVGVGAGVTREC